MRAGEDRLRCADRLALSLKAGIERIIIPLSRAAAAFVRERAWFAFGYARLEDHARERFGRSGRWVRNLAVLGEAIQSTPRLAAALTGDDGGKPIGWVAALAVARIATPETLTFWIGLARESTVRDLQDAVRRARAAPDVGGPMGHGKAAAADDVDDDGDRELVRLFVPAPVASAFDEALDLYRAVEGHHAPVTSFIEMLVAESAASATPPDVDVVPLQAGPNHAEREQALAGATGSWSHLPQAAAAGWASQLADDGLESLRVVESEAGEGDHAALDRQIRTLLQLEDVLQARLGRVLAEMGERGDWPRLMFDGVGHYGEERLRISRTTAEDRARAARTLRSRPRLRAAYESGRVGLEAVLLITRILGSAPLAEGVEQSWVDRGIEATIKRLRDEARALGCRGAGRQGSRWSHARNQSKPRTRIGAADESQMFDPQGGPSPLEDAEWQESLSRPPGCARRRVLRLGLETLMDVGGELPSPDVFLRFRLPADLAAAIVGTIESRRRWLTSTVEQVPWDQQWPDPAALPSVLAARTFSTRSRRVPSWVGLLSILEEFVCTWDTTARDGPSRAAVKQAIYIRDGWRCMAPGCTSRRNLEDHHLVYRSRGGNNTSANRICLCRFHHQRGEHGGLSSCVGTAPLGITWRLGRREVAQAFRNERRLPAAVAAAARVRSYGAVVAVAGAAP